MSVDTSNDVRAVETVIVGGGQAGLAAGHHLRRRDRPFAILDAGERTGDSWRHRWDSLRLFTPAGFSHLPGMPFPADRSAFPSKDEAADYLAAYAEHLQLPVEHRVRVERLERAGHDFLLTAGPRRWRARNVIVATGGHAVPRIPAFASHLAPEIAQLSALEYRNPDQLPAGPVLVVGAGNSGAEIGLDLATHSAGPTRRVHLAGRDVGYVPGPALGNGVYPLLRLLGGWGAAQVGRALRGGADPLGRVRPGDLAAAAIIRLPRVAGVRDGMPLLADGRAVAVRTVVWCTGARPDHDWIALPGLDDTGLPVQRRGVSAQPGLYFLGLPFQSTITSHLLGGVGRDARSVVRHLLRTVARPTG